MGKHITGGKGGQKRVDECAFCWRPALTWSLHKNDAIVVPFV